SALIYEPDGVSVFGLEVCRNDAAQGREDKAQRRRPVPVEAQVHLPQHLLRRRQLPTPRRNSLNSPRRRGSVASVAATCSRTSFRRRRLVRYIVFTGTRQYISRPIIRASCLSVVTGFSVRWTAATRGLRPPI